MLDSGAPVDAQDPYGNTVLHTACQNGNKRIVKACLRRGCDTNAQNIRFVPYSCPSNQQLYHTLSSRFLELIVITPLPKPTKNHLATSRLLCDLPAATNNQTAAGHSMSQRSWGRARL
jgi:ankyrin repeat protein